jgi:histidine triad (HIT) family protein
MVCIFCQIVEGKIPSHRIYEDENVLAILDINQTTNGHTLVMPKHHHEHFLNTPKALIDQVMHVAQSIGQAQVLSLGAKGVNILSNAMQAAGQSVMHFHVHVIPRYLPSDRLKIEMLENTDKMKANLPNIAQILKKTITSKN